MCRPVKCFLIDRSVICREEENTAFMRDPSAHAWVEDPGCFFLLTSDYDGLIEEIDYDPEKEEILALRRQKGFWISERGLRSYPPSETVAAFLERSGLRYEDVYGGDYAGDFEGMLRAMPDLLSGLGPTANGGKGGEERR